MSCTEVHMLCNVCYLAAMRLPPHSEPSLDTCSSVCLQLSLEHTVNLASILQPEFLQFMTDNEARRRQEAYAMS